MKEKTFYRIFDVNYVGLSIGKHLYSYSIDSGFLEHFPDSLLENVDLTVEVGFNKRSQVLFLLDFNLRGYYLLNCDRCLDEIKFPVNYNHNMIAKVEGEIQKDNNDEDIIYLTMGDYKINLVDPIYQIMNTQLPLKISCDLTNKDCNENYIEKLNSFSEQSDQNEIDSRWDELRKIKNSDKRI